MFHVPFFWVLTLVLDRVRDLDLAKILDAGICLVWLASERNLLSPLVHSARIKIQIYWVLEKNIMPALWPSFMNIQRYLAGLWCINVSFRGGGKGEKLYGSLLNKLIPVSGIRNILVRIRIRIPGFAPLTNGSGSISRSDSFLYRR